MSTLKTPKRAASKEIERSVKSDSYPGAKVGSDYNMAVKCMSGIGDLVEKLDSPLIVPRCCLKHVVLKFIRF